MNVNYCAKSKSVEVLVDQIGQNTKKKKRIISAQNELHTLFTMS